MARRSNVRKREQGRSKAYLDKVADTYKALAEGFPGNVNDITCQQLGKWLAGRKKPDGSLLSNNSFNHYRSDMMGRGLADKQDSGKAG